MCGELDRLRRSVETLAEVLEEKDEEIAALQANNQNLDLLIDAVRSMAELYRTRFDTLPGNTQNVIRAYDRYIGSLQQEPQTIPV